MNQEPCSVCGSKDLNLIDGYYYCVECGTQDINARETVIETNELGDGTLGYVAKRKIKTAGKDDIQMSPEWTKWHAFNFIMRGLADEVGAVGAAPSFRTKLLWVWTRYMKKFHVKEDMLTTQLDGFYDDSKPEKPEEDEETKRSEDEDSEEEEETKIKGKDRDFFGKQFPIHEAGITISILLSLIYIALNLDQSDILLTDLMNLIEMDHINLKDCTRYVPKELKVHTIPNWTNFMNSVLNLKTRNFFFNMDFRYFTMKVFKELDLGNPIVPNLRVIVDKFVKELCLPQDFGELVYSLMELVPCEFLNLDKKSSRGVMRIPDFELVVMSYIVMALKMCFGLDDQYDIKLSDAVDKINREENRPQSNKIGSYSDETNRLFSFSDWCNFLAFRRTVLSDYFTPMGRLLEKEVDDYVFMENTKDPPAEYARRRNKPLVHKTLIEEITMELLDRVPLNDEGSVIPISEFMPTLLPVTTYTEVVLNHLQDPASKSILSEDFTRYSLKYACVDLKLPSAKKALKGVRERGKIVDSNFHEEIFGAIEIISNDFTMVYVKNCENKNWLKTKPPTKDHVKVVREFDIDSNSDRGYDSNQEQGDDGKTNKQIKTHDDESDDDKTGILNDTDLETVMSGSEIIDDTDSQLKLELMPEEEAGKSIFDDDFEDLYPECKKETPDTENEDPPVFNNRNDSNHYFNDHQVDGNLYLDDDNDSDDDEIDKKPVFDREETIKSLVYAACREYKIPIPPEYKQRAPRKRPNLDTNNDENMKRQKTNTKKGEAKKEADKILTVYYANLERELLKTVSETIQTLVEPNQITDNTANQHDMSLDNIENEPDINVDNINKNVDGTDKNVDSTDKNVNSTDVNVDKIDKVDQDKSNALDTNDSCVLEGTVQNSDEDSEPDDLCPADPKFDEKSHDVRQLYLKFKDDFKIDDILNPNDPDIDKVLLKQLRRAKDNDFQESSTYIGPRDVDADDYSDFSEDDELPLQVIKETQPIRNKPCKEPLVNQDTKLKTFRYWVRSYPAVKVFKTSDGNTKLERNFYDSFPKSFQFVFRECAMLVRSSFYMLFRTTQTLELRLVAKARRYAKVNSKPKKL